MMRQSAHKYERAEAFGKTLVQALYGTTATARQTDPNTSHEAAVFIEDTGAAASHRAKATERVKATPGLTCSEYAQQIGIDRAALSKRLPEIERDGYIRKGEPRIGLGKGKESTWWPTEAAMQSVMQL
jgi:hypothetical protein